MWEWPTTKYVQISWTDKKERKNCIASNHSPYFPKLSKRSLYTDVVLFFFSFSFRKYRRAREKEKSVSWFRLFYSSPTSTLCAGGQQIPRGFCFYHARSTDFEEKLEGLWSNISNMRRSVSSPDETPRRELKIRRAAEYFWRTSRCFIWWWNTVSNVWYFFSNKIIFEGEIKDANTEQFFIRFPNTH